MPAETQMSPERWQRIERLYHSAIERTVEERAAFLREACGDDEGLRREIEELLEQDPRTGLLDRGGLVAGRKLLLADSEPLEPGRRIGRHEIRGKLAEGGMGVVYRAHDSTLRREVALKVLPVSYASDANRRDRLLREARAASALSHPNIVTVYEVGSEQGVDFIAMELVAGKPLNEVIPAKGLPLHKALDYAVQIAGGMAKAHAAGVIHRDLKPRNIMVTGDGAVKLLDFGLARQVQLDPEDNTLTAAGEIVGTPAYMSPEQAEGKPVDARSDIFSFGVVLYEMLSGHTAFSGDSRAAVLASVLREEPAPLSERFPEALRIIVRRCMRKDPARRFQHIDDVKVELQELLDVQPAVSELPHPRGWKWPVAAIGSLLVLGALSFAWLRTRTPAQDWKALPLISSAVPERAPSFSPDGSKVAFVWTGEKGDSPGIYVKQIGAAAPPIRITKTTGGFPAWSPDDRWVAFLRPEQDGSALMVVPPIGGPERKLAHLSETGEGLSWTPDAKWLAFSAADSMSEPLNIWAIAVDTGERRRVTSFASSSAEDRPTSTPLGVRTLAFSPDGLYLAFARQTKPFLFEVDVIRINRELRSVGALMVLSNRKHASVKGIAWTADGNEVLYGGGGSGIQDLWRASVSGGSIPARLPFQASAIYPAIARTPPRLAYTWMNVNSNLWRLDTRTGERTMLIGSAMYGHGWPEYSPDGRKIAFGSNRTGNWEVYTCDADGTNCVQLTFFDGPQCGTPRWSPDGHWLTLDSFVGGRPGVYVMPSDGGAPRRIADNGSLPVWSPDGHWIYFGSSWGGKEEVWKVPSGGGTPEPVTRFGGWAPRMSPDGAYVYYRKTPTNNPESLFRMPVGGGEEKQVLPLATPYYVVTAKGIYFTPDHMRMQLLEFGSGKVKTLAVPETSLYWGVTVSPGDDYVVWVQRERGTTSLMLVEGFR